MNDKYEWLIETTADAGYPMEIISGSLYYEDGTGESIPSSQVLLLPWWGVSSGTMVVGERYRPLPVGMQIAWFSYAENKFYKGKFTLDKEKIKSLFKEGFNCNGEKKNYSAFTVAIAPGGQVYLYLTGSNSVLVGNFTAKEYFVSDFKQAMNAPIHVEDLDREEYVQAYIKKMPSQTQREIANRDINTHIWQEINRRYPWKYTVKTEDSDRLPLTMQKEKQGALFISSEQIWCLNNTDYLTKPFPKPIPLEVDGRFKTSAGREFTIRIYPGNVNGKEPRMQTYEVRRAREQELVKLFKDFYDKIGDQEFEIQVQMSEDFDSAKVYLKKGSIMQEIPNTEIFIYDRTFDR